MENVTDDDGLSFFLVLLPSSSEEEWAGSTIHELLLAVSFLLSVSLLL
jgi:hypothetical protein